MPAEQLFTQSVRGAQLAAGVELLLLPLLLGPLRDFVWSLFLTLYCTYEVLVITVVKE